MTLPRLYAMNKQWEKAPPVAVSVAAFAGVKSATRASTPAASNDAAIAAWGANLPTMKIPRAGAKRG